jgi:hypothetical protein
MKRLGILLALTAGWASGQMPAQKEFASPEEAVQALVSAAQAKDQQAMMAIFGPEREKLLTGDAVADGNALARFGANLGKAAQLDKVSDVKYTLLVGENKFPFPIPLVKEAGGWRFDTPAGLDEIVNRRIGRNELTAIGTCRAYVVAQWEYFTQPLDTMENGLAVYAQHLVSKSGTHDGLYWDTPEGAPPSPLGKLIEDARAQGYTPGRKAPGEAAHQRTPYHGYYLRILKAQGPHAPGGKFSYIINGNMIAGYALVAYPSKWGSTGVMTFIVNQQGRVYQKNLGPNTAQIVRAMTEYDPDPTWKLVEDQEQ